jgi:hypothetical protein
LGNSLDAKKKRPAFSSGALLCRAEGALINYNIVRIARADYPLGIDKAVHVNRNPAVIHEHEVRTPDQPEVARPETLDEELFRMPTKTEHFAVTRLELLLIHRRRLARARTRPSLSLVYVLSATLNVRLSTYLSRRLRFSCLRFCLRFVLLLHVCLLLFRRRSCLRFLRLFLRRLLWLRLA